MKLKKCKICGEQFEKLSALQQVCSFSCSIEYANNQKIKAWNKKKTELKVKSEAYKKEFKQTLQIEINRLAKMIDAKFSFPCIDCGKPFGKQIDAGHFTSVGANASLRFNLHNIHSQKSDCNQNGLGGGQRLEYRRGLESRYSLYYAEYVEFILPSKYPLIKLTSIEMQEKTKIVRKLIRDFNTFEISDPIKARDYFNKIIGIYM